MSYGYNQGGGYGSNPYASHGQGQRNPFNDSNSRLTNNSSPAPAYDAYSDGNAMEMGRVQAPNPQNILNECRQITDGTNGISRQIERLEAAQRRVLASTSTDRSNPAVREVDATNADILAAYKSLINRLTYVKRRPESGSPTNQAQVGLADRQLRATYQRYLQVENDFQKRMREQTARQYRITRPDATEEEVRQATEDPSQQIFQQALMRSDRRGESTAVLSAVRDRHQAIQKIERQMEELSQLFIDMDRMVIEQEPLVQQVDQKVEEAHTQIVEANTHLDKAVDSARAARRKKWICFWLSILIVLIIIVIIVVVVLVLKKS